MPTHKGDIAFPGGKVEEGDEDIISTAIRETCEELLIHEDQINPIGILDSIDTVEFKFKVFPILCELFNVDINTFNKGEVQEVYLVEVNYLKDSSNWHYRGLYDSDWIINIGQDVLWGATAKLTLKLLRLEFSEDTLT